MNKTQFIYHYTDIFLSVAVKETILVENWEETKDFDPRYEEYAKSFFEMQEKFLVGGLSDTDIINELKKEKNSLVEKFNEKFKILFKNEIDKHKCTEKIAYNLLPEDLFPNDKINESVLKSFRSFEETYLYADGGKS